MDDYFSFLQNTLSSDLLEKMKTYTEQNILASVECANKLSRVRNFQEICRIQTEFMQTQWNSFGEQAKSLGEAYTKAAAAAMKAIPFNMSSWNLAASISSSHDQTRRAANVAKLPELSHKAQWARVDIFAESILA
jgi:tRNA(Leu) C34 or U34 (ribose-2'-O)-methylase TrmL